MNPKKIKGVYTVRAGLSAVVNGYAFAGNNRNSQLVASDSQMLTFRCDDIRVPLNNTCSFISNNNMRIKRARIVTNGAAGLRPSVNNKAANILLVGRALNDITSQDLGSIYLGFDFFNEWQEIDASFLPTKVNDNFYFSFDKSYTRLTIDDYNIQDEYIGESFNAVLEMIIDTAGILDNNGGIV